MTSSNTRLPFSFCESLIDPIPKKIQTCDPSIPIPRIISKDINPHLISCAKYDDDLINRNIVGIELYDSVYQNGGQPDLILDSGNIVFWNHQSNEYIKFDPDLVDNVYSKIIYNKASKNAPESYVVVVEPLNCELPMVLSNVTLYTPTNYNIKDVSTDGNHIEISRFTQLQSFFSSSFLSSGNSSLVTTSNPDLPEYQGNANNFYYKINPNAVQGYCKSINNITEGHCNISNNSNTRFELTDLTYKSKSNFDKLPALKLSGGSLQYLNQDNIYENFDTSLYQNLKVKAYQPGTLDDNYYVLVIGQSDLNKPAIFGDQTLYPFQNYMIGNGGVLSDGTIDLVQISNLDSYILNLMIG